MRWLLPCRVTIAALAIAAVMGHAAAAEPVIQIYPQGVLPNGPTPERTERLTSEINVWNVSQPSLTVFQPPHGRANGAAVIVAPGGGFWFLSWENEGTRVAQRLADEGFTAFVLRYRLDPMPDDPTAFQQASMARLMALIGRARSDGGVQNLHYATEDAAAADAAEAVRLVRRRASEWNVDPKRVGFVGFSAGGITAANVATLDPSGRPDFVGIIYGALHHPVPADAPPAFIAASADDALLGDAAIPMFQAWRAAGRPAELHLFEKGGHGWGASAHGFTSDHWFDEMIWWMRAHAAPSSGAAAANQAH
ncbi:MAG: alpha/beta hydrolase [Terricaulis sp.]